MATRLEQYEEIQSLVKKDIESMFESLYKQYATKYGVSSTPLHYHNGSDAPNLPAQSLVPFVPLPATAGGIANQDVLNGQVMNDTTQASNPQLAGTKNAPTIYVDPLPIVYSSGSQTFNGGEAPIGTAIIHTNPTEAGTTLWLRVNSVPGFTGGTFTTTGNIPLGSTSATLNANWPYPTGIYWVTFTQTGADDQYPVGFQNGSTAVNWDSPTTKNSSSTLNVSAIGWVGVNMNQLIPV